MYFLKDVLYDEVNRSGLIQSRLRVIHKNVNTTQGNPKAKRAAHNNTGGPKPKTPRPLPEEPSPEIVNFDAQILELNGICSKTGCSRIKDLILETLPHRNLIRQNNQQSILKIYPKFLECDYLVKYVMVI